MTMGDKDRLVRRIRQVRRSTVAREDREGAAAGAAEAAAQAAEAGEDPIRSLTARVEHLEHLLEGLQDSVHREFERHQELIAGLQNEIEPSALGAALAEDARRRGL
jgi:HPt (histidine-containing phosphotransfer) domain-containing protein